MQSTRTIHVYKSTRAAFFLSTHLCTHTEAHLLLVFLGSNKALNFLKEEVLDTWARKGYWCAEVFAYQLPSFKPRKEAVCSPKYE